MIDVKPFSGRRPFPLLGAPSIHRLLRGADLPLRGLQAIARQIQLQDYAVMNEAVDGLRTWGAAEFLPRGLLARAAFHRSQDHLDLVQRDLDEVRTLVRRTGMRLYEADLELEQTRWHLAKNDPDSARTTLDRAKDLIESMDYGRRRPEVEDLEAGLAALSSC